MREYQYIATNRIAGDKKPPANAFLQRVVTIADTRLRYLDQESVRVFQQQIAQERIPAEFLIQLLSANTKCFTAHLNDCPIRSHASEDGRHSDHSFIPNEPYFDSRAFRIHGNDGYQRIGQEI